MKNAFVESLKRLIGAGRITESKVVELHKQGKLTEDEMVYIIDKQKGGCAYG